MEKVLRRNSQNPIPDAAKVEEHTTELANEVVQCVTNYARVNPGSAALWCLGIGFVLGWKLKPW